MGYSTISPPNSKPLGVHGPAVWAADAKMLSMWKQRKGLKRDIMSVTRFARPLCTAGNASDASQCRTGTSCRGSRTDRRIRSRNRTRTPAWHSHALIVPRCVQPFMFLGRRYKPPACAGDAPAARPSASGKEESGRKLLASERGRATYASLHERAGASKSWMPCRLEREVFQGNRADRWSISSGTHESGGCQGSPRLSLLRKRSDVLVRLLGNRHDFSEIIQSEGIDVPVLTVLVAIPASERHAVERSPVVVVTENRG